MHKVLFCMYTYKYILIYLTSQSSGYSTFHQVGCTQTNESYTCEQGYFNGGCTEITLLEKFSTRILEARARFQNLLFNRY